MNFLDYIVVIGYLAILLYMGFALRQQENKGDYFLRTDYLPNRLFKFDGIRLANSITF